MKATGLQVNSLRATVVLVRLWFGWIVSGSCIMILLGMKEEVIMEHLNLKMVFGLKERCVGWYR